MATRPVGRGLNAYQRTQLNKGARSATRTFRARPGIAEYGDQVAQQVRYAVQNRLGKGQIQARYDAAVAGGFGGNAARAFRAGFRSYGVEIKTPGNA